MSATSLEHKTIRPGSLIGYSYYHSDRRPMSAATTARPVPRLHVQPKLWRWALAAVLVLAVLIVGPLLRGNSTPATSSATSQVSKTSLPNPTTTAPAITGSQAVNRCAGNKSSQLVLVNIGQRHLWACDKGRMVYSSAVITGMEAYASTRTPVGTYSVHGKQTNTRLTGSDEAGSWDYPVKYWMPFLVNKHGTYGFHDATWRPDSDFGNVDPNSKNASHGCVELPLGGAKWLYDWSNVGTTVTIES